MEKKNSQTHKFEIKNYKDVFDYCFINGITDINSFAEKCFKQGFDIEKYGLIGEVDKVVEKEVIKEVIKEIKVEVPVEKIVEVVKYVDKEIIKEVPVETVVEKVITVYDKTEENELLLKIQQLENENKKISNSNEIVDDEKTKMLQGTLQSLKKQLSLRDEKIKELENKISQLEKLTINQGAVFMKGSNLSQNL